MGFESNTGLGVNNHYGARDVGGEEGVIKTEGIANDYEVNFDAPRLDLPFPVLNGCLVTGVSEDFSTGAVTVATIGGVDVSAATEAAPVELLSTNTGEVVLTGPTAGSVIVAFLRVA